MHAQKSKPPTPPSLSQMLTIFSLSYWHAVWSAIGIILSSVSQWRCVLWLNDTSYGKRVLTSEKEVPSAHWNTISQLSSPYIDPMPQNSAPPNLENTYLLYHVFLITWPFCLRCYEQGTVLLSRWSLINALYAARSAIAATAVLFVVLCTHVGTPSDTERWTLRTLSLFHTCGWIAE